IADQTYQIQDYRSLQKIVENVVNKAMKEKPFEGISVSKLSGTKMIKIEKTMEYYSVEDVHKSIKKEIILNKACTILQESQAKGELLIKNTDVALDVLVILTDCNEK
ncbi:5994_t:CDS:2, partial [Diversispora eburnea]